MAQQSCPIILSSSKFINTIIYLFHTIHTIIYLTIMLSELSLQKRNNFLFCFVINFMIRFFQQHNFFLKLFFECHFYILPWAQVVGFSVYYSYYPFCFLVLWKWKQITSYHSKIPWNSYHKINKFWHFEVAVQGHATTLRKSPNNKLSFFVLLFQLCVLFLN